MKLCLKISLSTLAFALLPAVASAEGPTAKERAHERVNQGLVQPLKKQEEDRSAFSRVIQSPKERRVRILQTRMSHDHKGRTFLAYAIDVRYGDEWKENIQGCVYTQTGNIYVDVGDEYRSHEFLLGKDVKPVAGVCQAAPARDEA